MFSTSGGEIPDRSPHGAAGSCSRTTFSRVSICARCRLGVVVGVRNECTSPRPPRPEPAGDPALRNRPTARVVGVLLPSRPVTLDVAFAGTVVHFAQLSPAPVPQLHCLFGRPPSSFRQSWWDDRVRFGHYVDAEACWGDLACATARVDGSDPCPVRSHVTSSSSVMAWPRRMSASLGPRRSRALAQAASIWSGYGRNDG